MQTRAPSLSYIRKILIEKEIIGFITASISLPFLLLDQSQTQNVDEILENNDYINYDAYNNEVYKKIMIQRLQEWETLGLFEYNV